MFFLNEKTSHNKNNDIQGSHNKIKITDVQKKSQRTRKEYKSQSCYSFI